MKSLKENPAISDEIIADHGLKKSEYDYIVELIGRHPNINELGMFSVMWSEHCSYKCSKILLDQFPTCGENIVCGPGENAGVVDIGDGIHIVFKVESHNHPTAVEPFQGATTGVGGILRDIFTMGARPIANLNSLRFGNLDDKRNCYLFSNAVEGIAWYGNCVGVPTVGGECWFEDVFSGNPLVNALCVGIMYEGDLIKAGAAGIGNPVIYVGSDTGRDGMAGAAFASKEITEKSIEDRPAVQVGDPFKGKLLIESCLESFKTGYVLAAQDMGAAGITCSVSEMASKGNVGISLDLSKIPSRGENITPYEYLLSESQERMLIVAERGKENKVIEIFKKWGLNAVIAGEVIKENRIIILHNNKVVVDLPADALTNKAPVYDLPAQKPEPHLETSSVIDQVDDIKLEDIENVTYKLLESFNICSRNWVFRQYDRQVQNNSIMQSEQYSSALIRVRDQQGNPLNKAIALSMDCNSRLTYFDPYQGALQAVAESARNVVCVGAKPIAITNNLNFANPEKPEGFWQLKEACRGIKDACNAFKISVTGGNVSLYNETDGIPIYPTPVIGMLGLIEDYRNALKPVFKSDGDVLIQLGSPSNNLDGSEYASYVLNKKGIKIPDINFENELRLQNFILSANKNKLLNSCADISEGGLLTSILESSVISNKGVLLVKNMLKITKRIDASLFGESPSRAIITVSQNNLKFVEDLIKENDLQYNILGKIQPDIIEIDETPVKIDIYRAKQIWEAALERKMNT